MKQVVCREDIKAELDMLSDMKLTIQMLESQISILQDRLELLEAKTSVINSMNTSVSSPVSASVNVPEGRTNTTDIPHMYWGEAISNAAERLQDASERIRQDGHWVVNDDGTVTFIRD